MNKKISVTNILKIIIALAIFIIAILNYKTLSNLDIRLLIAGASSVLIAELIILGVYVVKSVLLILPASLIYISVGMAFDWKQAVVINLLGILIEVIITYFLGKFLGQDAVEKKIKGTKYGDKLMSMLEKNPKLATFLIRFIPAFPIDFSSLFMGAFNFKFLPYVIFSFFGIAPRVIAFTILGDGIYDYIPMKYIVLVVIVAIPVAVIAGLIKSKMNKNKDKSSEDS